MILFPVAWKVTKMTKKEAIKALILSPFYFRLDLAARKALIREFCGQAKQESEKDTLERK